jgi:hypothetical protein
MTIFNKKTSRRVLLNPSFATRNNKIQKVGFSDETGSKLPPISSPQKDLYSQFIYARQSGIVSIIWESHYATASVFTTPKQAIARPNRIAICTLGWDIAKGILLLKLISGQIMDV